MYISADTGKYKDRQIPLDRNTTRCSLSVNRRRRTERQMRQRQRKRRTIRVQSTKAQRQRHKTQNRNGKKDKRAGFPALLCCLSSTLLYSTLLYSSSLLYSRLLCPLPLLLSSFQCQTRQTNKQGRQPFFSMCMLKSTATIPHSHTHRSQHNKEIVPRRQQQEIASKIDSHQSTGKQTIE